LREREQFGRIGHLLGREAGHGHQDISGKAWVTWSAETVLTLVTAAAKRA
jgi:hypothetical protein